MTIKRNAMGVGTPGLQAGALIGGVSDNLTATGSTQAGALLLSLSSDQFVTTTASGTGVILPPGNGNGDQLAPGDLIRVFNYGANTLLVYPPVGGKIQNGSTNAGFSIATLKGAEFVNRNGLDFGVNLSA